MSEFEYSGRVAAFIISAVYGSVGGVIFAVSTGLADPELAYWTQSGNLVFIALLGGSQTFAGPAIGALAFVILREFVISVTEYWRFFMGGTLILLVSSYRKGSPELRAISGFEWRGNKMAPMLEARSISKSYGEFHALSDVSISVDEGEFISVVGPNGAGKTTLVNDITGLLKPNAGEVRFRGEDIAGIGPVELAKRGMARSFQLVNIFPALTVRETLSVPVAARLGRNNNPFRSIAADKVINQEVDRIASVLRLNSRLETTASTLSQGEKKLLDIASAFALGPSLILLDEPTSGVSTADKHRIMQLLVSAAKTAGIRAIVQVEHDMDLVFRYSHRVIALQEGRVLSRPSSR